MFYITRKTFPDRLFSTADLSAAADLWRQWYLLSKHQFMMGERATVQLTARIHGLPRAEATEVQQRLSDATLVDPDTLEVREPATPVDGPLNAAAWDRTLAFAAGRPLVVLLYVAVVGETPLEPSGPTSVNTLLLAGLPRPDGLLVKAVHRLGAIGIDQRIFRGAAWPEEGKFLAALDRFRSSGDAAAAMGLITKPGKSPFQSSNLERKAQKLAGILVEMPGEHSPRAMVKHLRTPLVIGGCATAMMVRNPNAWPISAGGIGLASLIVGRVCYNKWKRIAQYRKAMNTGLARAYSRPPTFAKVDLAAAGLADDPNVLKYTADILALGAVHCYDFQITSLDTTQGTIRLFHLPADRTLISLMLLTKTHTLLFFPAKPIVSAKTYYDGGVMIATLAAKQAYRKPINPTSRGRCLPEETDPATLLARHRDNLGRLAPPGQEPLPVDPEDVFKLETAEHLKSQQLFQARGCYYTWSDAFHEGFEIPRRELVG